MNISQNMPQKEMIQRLAHYKNILLKFKSMGLSRGVVIEARDDFDVLVREAFVVHEGGADFSTADDDDALDVVNAQNVKNRIGVVSFTIDKIHPHEIAYLLDERAAILGPIDSDVFDPGKP